MIYVVTSGEYSDYGIDAVFDSKELAEAFIASFDDDGYNRMGIEEWKLNPGGRKVKAGLKAFTLRMDKEGKAKDINWADSSYWFKSPNYFIHDGTLLNCAVFAKDEKHAVKIANDRRAKHIANNTWGVNP